MQSKQDVETLNQAFQFFNQASSELEKSYRLLEKKVESLNRELDKKNRDLEENLAEKEEVKAYLHNILENLATGVIVLDLKGDVTVFNRMAEVLTGFSHKDVREKGVFEVLGIPGDAPSSASAMTSRLKKINGRILLYPMGREERTIHLTATGLYEENGPLIGGIFLLKDVTEIKRLEREAERKNRLTAMGEMSANIAHEIRNPLGSIELFASILRKELKDDGEHRNLAENIIVGVKSLNHILSNLLFYTRPLRPTCFPVSAHEIVDEALVFAEHALKQNGIQWTIEHLGPDIEIMSDGELLKQVCMNLFLNAVQSMPDGGNLEIASEVVDHAVIYRISDTGTGIKEDDLDRIFNPFFTTRDKGTGLGLAIVHQIVETLEGRIRVESRLHEGTSFQLTFPITVTSEDTEKLCVNG